MKITHFALLFCCFLSPSILAAECGAKSTAQPVSLLELYTSEGCSSCPPADRWLSKLSASDKVIPLALHVDYWDYIGWKDRFAQPKFATRQREQARFSGANSVYTPQVMLNGNDFRGWGNNSRFEDVIDSINHGLAQANIELSVKQPEANRIEVNASAEAPKYSNAALFIALYENGLSSEVKNGENSGATLKHDYVVREWLGPFTLEKGLNKQLTLKPEWKTRNMGAVAFVQNLSNGEVLQAVATKLCGG
ncbi:MAG: DUF1223 domain-containing protein [Methylophilaceae bacterium]